MKIPEYIRRKMHHIAKLNASAAKEMAEVETWLEAHGFDISEDGLRCGDGCSLEELDYGFDITDALCERLESGFGGEP